MHVRAPGWEKRSGSSTLKLALKSASRSSAAPCSSCSATIYWSTETFILGRADQKLIAAEQAALTTIYGDAGRGGLATAIAQRIADPRLGSAIYLLADGSFAPIAGNLARWPATLRGADGWVSFTADDGTPGAAAPPLRARVTTLADGAHLLIGRDIGDLAAFNRTIDIALGLGAILIFTLAGVADRDGDAAHRRADQKQDQRHQPRHHAERARPAHSRCAAPRTNGTSSPRNLNP